MMASRLSHTNEDAGQDYSPQPTSGYKRQSHFGNIQNLYTTSPAPNSIAPQNMPRQYSSASMPRFDKSGEFTHGMLMKAAPTLSKYQHLIDWINSFNDPYCLLINQMVDLTDGIALSHMVGYIACSPSDQEKIKQLVYYDATTTTGPIPSQLSLQNLDLALNVLKSSNLPIPGELQPVQALALTEPDSPYLILFLETLRSINEILSFSSPKVVAEDQAQQVPSLPFPEAKEEKDLTPKAHKPTPAASQGSFTPHYTSTQSMAIASQQQQNGQSQQAQIAMSQRGLPVAGPTMVTPRCHEKTASQSQHSRPQIMSQSSAREAPLSYRMTEHGTDSNNKSAPQLLSIQSDNKSFKENTAPQQNVMPFPNNSQLLRFNQPAADVRTIESLDLNTISPIGNNRRSMSPIDAYKQIRVPKVNVQAAIDRAQQNFHDQEEQQLNYELSALDASYQRIKGGDQPYNQVRGSSRNNSSNSKSGRKSSRIYNGGNITNSQEQRERIRQRQQEVNDYGNVLKNTQNLMMRSKTTDSDVNFQFLETRSAMKSQPDFVMEPPPSIMMESRHQVFSERLVDTSVKHKYPVTQFRGSQDDNQKSIRFKEGTELFGNRIEKAASKKSKQVSNDDDEIMSEMQTLNVKPSSKETSQPTQSTRTMMVSSEIKIDQVDLKTKQRVLEWLSSDVKLVKYNERLIEELPFYCKNGVFLCDLANRLSGKINTINGVDRNPKNVTHIVTNFNRVLDYFRSFPRFCSRYLWAQRYLIEGSSDVVWGLLDDIWHWHFNKISPYDPTHDRNLTSPLRSPNTTKRVLSPKLPPKQATQPILNIQTAGEHHQKHLTSNRPALPPKSAALRKDIGPSGSSRNDHTGLNISQSYDLRKTPIKGGEDSIRGEKAIAKDRSYSNLHAQQKTPQKSVLKNNSEMPLQRPASAKKEEPSMSRVQDKAGSARSTAKRVNSGRSKRVDVSAYNSPIAKDRNGTFYYMKNQEEFMAPPSFEDRNANQLFSSNRLQGTHQQLVITEELEAEIRNWLFNLGFAHYLSKEFEYRDICNDPFSNGILFAELFSYLEKITLFKVIQAPKTISESRENLSKVLSIIRQKRRDFPQRLLCDMSIENILKRDKQTIFLILYFMKQAYPNVKVTQPPSVSSMIPMNAFDGTKQVQNLALPYSQGELKLLEISLINWLKRLNLFSKLYGSSFEIESLVQVQKDISNGIFLADLVALLFNVKLHGIFKDPKTEATAVANIRKPLEVLRRQSRMSQKFTWADKEIYEGRLSVVIGLFEDLHRCFDGLPSRKRGLNYFSDGPYLGDTLYDNNHRNDRAQQQTFGKTRSPEKPQDVTMCKLRSSTNSLKKQMEATQNTQKTAPDSIKFDVLIEQNKFQDIPSIFNNPKLMMGSEVTTSTLNPQKILQSVATPSSNSINLIPPNQKEAVVIKDCLASEAPQRQVNFGLFLNQKLKKEQSSVSPLRASLKNFKFPMKLSKEANERQSIDRFIKKHKFTHIGQQCEDILTSHKKELTDQYPIAPTRSPLNVNSRCQSFEFEIRSNLKRPTPALPYEGYFENEEHNLNRFAYNLQEKAKITDWIRDIEGLVLPLGFNLEVEPITFFRDGILLCNLVSELEGHRIENIQMQPKSQAGCLQNIRKALQILKKKNQVPLYLLYSEEEIYSGNPEIVLQLLKSLRAAYKNRVVRRTSTSQTRKSKEWQQQPYE